jgi:hypothetical protein
VCRHNDRPPEPPRVPRGCSQRDYDTGVCER